MCQHYVFMYLRTDVCIHANDSELISLRYQMEIICRCRQVNFMRQVGEVYQRICYLQSEILKYKFINAFHSLSMYDNAIFLYLFFFLRPFLFNFIYLFVFVLGVNVNVALRANATHIQLQKQCRLLYQINNLVEFIQKILQFFLTIYSITYLVHVPY